jgi:SAM-dependent methyltransferase
MPERYLLDNQQPEAGDRFDALSALFDPVTFRHIERLGIGPGWRCWEVGARNATIPRWLCARVGVEGHVLATDIDMAWMPGDAPFEMRRHDVGVDPPPGEGFDLVHARLVLVHVPQRDAALAALVTTLRPGGWLLLEEADPALQPLACPDETGPDEELANRLRHGFRALMAERGVDLAYGRTLPRRLRAAGLIDVEADAYFPVTSPAAAGLERATMLQLRGRLVAAGLASEEDIDRHVRTLAGGRLDVMTSPLISCWGRRPPA